MKKSLTYTLILSLMMSACQTVILDPPPVDILTDDLVLKRATDWPGVRVGLYNSFRSISSPQLQAGDFTADNIIHIGTFTDYQELGSKQITPANGVVSSLWTSIYKCVYTSNFILERLQTVVGMKDAEKKVAIAEVRFLRGLSNFYGAYSFGNIPKPASSDVTINRTIAKSPKDEVLKTVLDDFQAALSNVSVYSTTNSSSAYINKNTVRAALARYYLYQKNWVAAEAYADTLIRTGNYSLVPYDELVLKDFTKEAIFEVGYTISDDPGEINNLFIGRREVIPSNQIVAALFSRESGTRKSTLTYDFNKQKGNDNGWSLNKYGTKDQDNNNYVVFRLGEMYLIRAEARAQQGKLSTTSGGVADVNVLRTRAGLGLTAATAPPLVGLVNQADLLTLIEKERVYELAFEGHRWYDLVRTARAQAVMSAFSSNWTQKYEIWPVPIREIQSNPALTQNSGY